MAWFSISQTERPQKSKNQVWLQLHSITSLKKIATTLLFLSSRLAFHYMLCIHLSMGEIVVASVMVNIRTQFLSISVKEQS